MKLFRKAVLTAAAVLSVLSANAEGYQINSQSARQWGMAHTGTALKLGAESMLFNPAGMVYMNSKFDVSLGTILIKSKVDFEQPNYKHETDNPLSTPIFGHFAYKPCEKLALGINITNPAGNSMVWGDNWTGATHIQEVSLKAFNIQPTVSYKINDFISVGAGLMIDFGSFSQEKALIGKNQLEAFIPLANKLAPMIPSLGTLPPAIQSFHDMYAAEIELEGSSKVSYGFNIGALVNITPKLTFGVNYRSKVKLSVEGGEAEIDYANKAAEEVVKNIASFSLPAQVAGMLDETTMKMVEGVIGNMDKITKLDGAKFDASMPIPSILSFGLTYQPNDAWTLTGETQITGWSAYKTLSIDFKTLAEPEVSEKNYKNTVAVRLGAQYVVSDFWTVRAGAYMDTPPVQMDNYNPETPSANSYGVTAGATLNPMKNLAIDLSVGYLRGEKTTGSYQNGTFVADYTKSAIMPGIGVRFQF